MLYQLSYSRVGGRVALGAGACKRGESSARSVLHEIGEEIV